MTVETTHSPSRVRLAELHFLIVPIARVVAASAVVVSLGMAPARSEVTDLTVNKCLAGKIKSTGKSVGARTGCFSKEASGGVGDPACHQKASDKFTGGSDPSKGAFGKLETKYPSTGTTACLTFGDQSAFETDIANYAASVPVATGSNLGKCDAAKLKCIGKYVAGRMNCDAKAAGKTGNVDSACAAKAVAKLANGSSGCLDKAASNADCTNGGSQATSLIAAADEFILISLCTLDPGAISCPLPTPTPTATATATASPTPTVTATPTLSPTPIPCPTGAKSVAGACWRAGTVGQSCDAACGNAGEVYNPATATYAGSDGSDQQCHAVIDAFGGVPLFYGGVNCDTGGPIVLGGVGCCVNPSTPQGAVGLRCTAPPTTSSAANASVRRLCACQSP